MEIVVNGPPVDTVREEHWAERDRRREAEQDRLLAALSLTMDVPRFVESTQPGAMIDGQPIPVEHVAHLRQEIALLCQQYDAGWLQQRFALHPEVIGALLRYGRAAYLLDGGCAACKLPLPYRLHLEGEGFGLHSGPRVFTHCPDCGSGDLRSMYARVPRPLDGPR